MNRKAGCTAAAVALGVMRLPVPALSQTLAGASRASLVKNWAVPDFNLKRITGNKAETSVRGFWYDDARQGLWAAYGDTYNVAGWHDPSIMFLSSDGPCR